MKLPKFAFYEQGSQIRRSSKSVKDTIVEGYGRRKYKAEYIKYLTYAIASCDETTNSGICNILRLIQQKRKNEVPF
jgi:four helix bundle protein